MAQGEQVTPRDFMAEVVDEMYRMDSPEWDVAVPVETLIMRLRMVTSVMVEAEMRQRHPSWSPV